MKRYLGIAALALALTVGISTVNVGTATAIGSPDPLKVLEAQEVAEDASAIFNWGENKGAGEQYRVLETEEEVDHKEIIRDAGAGV